MPVTVRYLENRLKVDPLEKITFKYSNCHKVDIPKDILRNGIPDVDLVIFVSAAYEPGQSFVAWATAC